jgi:hypothetical protein
MRLRASLTRAVEGRAERLQRIANLTDEVDRPVVARRGLFCLQEQPDRRSAAFGLRGMMRAGGSPHQPNSGSRITLSFTLFKLDGV